MDRRLFLCAGLATISAFRAAPARSSEHASAQIAERARSLLNAGSAGACRTDVAAIVDFASPSWRPRLHIVDLTTSQVRSFLTAHGRGSDPSHTGWLKGFSNAIGSNATSKGAYKTAGLYDGKYGRSMRLIGLDVENSNAEARAIVIHPAWYAGDGMIEKYGKLGRSEGCFAVAENDHLEILDRLGSGALLYAGRF